MDNTERIIEFLNKHKGETVFYSGGWGTEPPVSTVLTLAEWAEEKNAIIVGVDNGHWGYTYQIEFDDLKTQMDYQDLIK